MASATARQVQPAVKRLAEFLGITPDAVIESTWHKATTACLSLETLLESDRCGRLSASAMSHIEICQRCAALWEAMAL